MDKSMLLVHGIGGAMALNTSGVCLKTLIMVVDGANSVTLWLATDVKETNLTADQASTLGAQLIQAAERLDKRMDANEA